MKKLNLKKLIDESDIDQEDYDDFMREIWNSQIKNAIKQAIKEALPEILQYVSERADADFVINNQKMDLDGNITQDVEVYVINSSILDLEQEILIKLEIE